MRYHFYGEFIKLITVSNDWISGRPITHPLEIIGWSVVAMLVSEGMLGVTANVAFWFSMIIVPIQVFEHTNIRTPSWLGYFIARPENHMLHHAKTKHRSNYADLPIIDMLFGTFELPKEAPKEVGFWNGASQEFLGKLLGKDISQETNTNST